MRTLLPKGDLARALAGFHATLVAISVISGVVNVLALTGAFPCCRSTTAC
jgi:hypothetical protein